MKIGDRVRNSQGELATVLEVCPDGVRLRFDADAEFAKRHGTSNKRAEQTVYAANGFTVVT